jgi:two-component system, OmpR family, copper resistance phosphate regulon response regulator CusR
MRILIIEDEKKVAQFIKKGFQSEAYSVDIALDGERGSYLAQTGEYDAIILDIMLPKKNGIEVLKETREAKIQTPILMLSAKSDIEDRVLGLNMGADDYLPKPFAFSELLARVRSLMRRVGGEKSFELSVGDLHVDIAARKVTRNSKEIILTNKEYELLEFLLRNKNRVLSRVILQEHVWDINFDTDTNIVDVLVNRLRKKIDDQHKLKLIETIRGVGYQIKVPEDDDF